jgi:hypothetical protein
MATPVNINAAAFTSVDLPNLRRLAIEHDAESNDLERRYDSIIPQLAHLFLYEFTEADLEHLLLLSTSLQSLHIRSNCSPHGICKAINQISRRNVEEMHVIFLINVESPDDWETNFELIEKFKKVLEGKDEWKRIELEFRFQYREDLSEDVCDQALERWKVMKNDIKLVCVKNGIEVVGLTCGFCHNYIARWEE